MGVINITPNSFSNLELNLSEAENRNILRETLKHFMRLNGCVLDIGFESTAPMNKSISREVERERFLYFLAASDDLSLSHQWISFDTYRPHQFLFFEEEIKKRHQDLGLIFNDVSGVIDDELMDLLHSKKDTKDFYYIYNYSHIPSRDRVLDHMKFQKEGDIVEMAFHHFKKGMDLFLKAGVADKIILDPGLGFSKSYEQNWDLIVRFNELLEKCEDQGLQAPWLLGLSKKSFLRRQFLHLDDPYSASEELHALTMRELLKKSQGQHLIFRAHDPGLVARVHAGL